MSIMILPLTYYNGYSSVGGCHSCGHWELGCDDQCNNVLPTRSYKVSAASYVYLCCPLIRISTQDAKSNNNIHIDTIADSIPVMKNK